ncbi:S8 family peptidase [Anaerococcus sp. NML200537]|uniref:S8 family peptidase n=1 Tax=Anaerococcus sp. NML200537 TaxID=2954485 RepID=UPI002239066C|nr:S8 family peptidase [Anaerococcus sp. NML200537]MCW6702603.1 S8 family peptidase [Anaerococcus sp. NML200537]
MTKELKKHFRIKKNKESIPFSPINRRGKINIPKRDRKSHADLLESQFKNIWDKEVSDSQKVSSISKRDGVYLQFRGKENYKLIFKSLEDTRQKVRLCSVKEEDGIQYATVFVPFKKKDFFLKKINKFKDNDKGTDVVASIESINEAMVNELWTDTKEIPIKDKEACEVWLSVYSNNTTEKVVEEFFNLCNQLEVKYYKKFVEFPERVVVSIMADIGILKTILMHSDHIAEFRKKTTPASFFIKENTRQEQKEWVDELLKRAYFKDSDLSICILDNGVNNGHPLISPVLDDGDMHTTFDDRILQDNSSNGHGTGMAGISTYFNLEEALGSNNNIEINHKLESVRFVDENIKNDVDLYADVTSRAISLVEISKPNNKRVIAMPVTAGFDPNADKKDKKYFRGDGKPTSWSAGIDNLALGNYGAENTDSRLIIISAGNTECSEIEEVDDYKVAVATHSVEDPAQSWNALTVGAFTNKFGMIEDPSYKSFIPLVEKGSYSPVTSSSLMWEHKWPIKPEIVLEGGNVGYNKDSEDFKYDNFEDLELLTTNKSYHLGKLFTTMNGTSSATAQAANLAIRIMNEYPNIWPQTVKAIMVHSARWTDSMIRQAFGDKEINKLTKTELRELLRIVGYGRPNLNQALYSLNNSVNLIIEDELQPFKKSKSVVTINEMSLHEIPWPSEVLIGLGETPVKMRVTLSYFIDPSPGEIGWEDKYRYPGCRLFFDVNNTNEDKEHFLYRINNIIKDEEKSKGISYDNKNDSNRWLLGTNNRNVGSIHSDIWEDTAANLAENRYIAVYPGGGWWKERGYLKKYDSKIKYSLIVSISTPEETIDLYSSIENKINIANKLKVETPINF